MLLSKVLLTALAIGGTSASPIYKRAFSYGSTTVKGANIGGWLVLEPWITPSIFQAYANSVVDEWTLCQNDPNADVILKSHWDSWVSLSDFQKLADNGFNLVRIPIGYWAFQKYDGDPYVQGAADYLETAIGWARQTGLQVWIDLHGAPLSQNGYDNSGHRVSTPGWTDSDSVTATQNVISMIASKYGGDDYSDVIAGIELLNEPLMASLPGGRSATSSYYQNGFDIVRSNGPANVVIHDGFDTPASWNGFLSGTGNANAVVDHHEYQVFSDADVALTSAEHVSAVYSRATAFSQGCEHTLIVGEWTAAMTDCAPALNGYGIGARYDGTYSKQNADGSFDSSSFVGSCSTKNFIDQWDSQMKQDTTAYIQAQITAYESDLQGWIFWNFKTEASAEWDLFRLIDYGVWPS